MNKAKFILSKRKLLEQVDILEKQNLKISYSYKTNHQVGDLLQEISKVDFSIHSKEEIKKIRDKSRIWFFTQAESAEELKEIINEDIRNLVYGIGGAVTLVGIGFIIESKIHIKKAGLLLNENGIGIAYKIK